MSLHFYECADSLVRAHAAHQHSLTAGQLRTAQQQLSELVALLKIKSPALLGQLQRTTSSTWCLGGGSGTAAAGKLVLHGSSGRGGLVGAARRV